MTGENMKPSFTQQVRPLQDQRWQSNEQCRCAGEATESTTSKTLQVKQEVLHFLWRCGLLFSYQQFKKIYYSKSSNGDAVLKLWRNLKCSCHHEKVKKSVRWWDVVDKLFGDDRWHFCEVTTVVFQHQGRDGLWQSLPTQRRSACLAHTHAYCIESASVIG